MSTQPTAIDPRQVSFLPLSALHPNPRNPKAHDSATIDASIGRFGLLDLIVQDGRTGFIVSGHGRHESLTAMRDRGESAPEGVKVDEGGDWLVPVVTGWASRTDTEATAALIALNRTTELGGWVDDALLELLEELGSTVDGLDGVGYSTDEIEDLQARLMELSGDAAHGDVLARAKRQPRLVPGTGEVDLILSINAGPSYAEAQAGMRLGWKPGVITSSLAAAMNYYSRFPSGVRIAFMDNEWHSYDHASHLAALSEVHPKYATTRDLLTKEQSRKAGVEWYSLAQTLEMAAEVAEHVENVILIPKYDCLEQLPDTIGGKQVVLGYSVPTSYGGTMIPPQAFKGRPVHLLGGAWALQRGFLMELRDEVVSLDNNHLMRIAQWGNVCLGDGTVVPIDQITGSNFTRHFFPAFVLSLGFIATAMHEEFGMELPVQVNDEDEDHEALYVNRDGDETDDDTDADD